MAFNVNNLVIDRILGAYGMNKNDEILFAINQVMDASLSVSSESTDVTDAIGNTIMTLYRAKKAEFSATNAIFDLDLLALQSGTEKVVASAEKLIPIPAFEEIVIDGSVSYDIAHAPLDEDIKVYAVNDDGSLGKAYTLGTPADAEKFAYSEKKITPPTGLANGARLMVTYEYNAGAAGEGAVAVISSAKDFPKECKLVLKALCYNPCDKETMIYALIILPSFRMSPDFDWNMSGGDQQGLPFSGMASVDYCSAKQELFRVVVPE